MTGVELALSLHVCAPFDVLKFLMQSAGGLLHCKNSCTCLFSGFACVMHPPHKTRRGFSPVEILSTT